MSLESYIKDESYVADAAIAAYRIVVYGESGNVHELSARHVKLPAAQDAKAIVGVSQNASSASGDTILVRRAGTTLLTVSSGNVTAGVPLRAFDIRGMADVQGDAWVSGDGVVGYAEEASSASGDVIECWLAIRTLLA